ncbi:MAG: tRNA (adenosine(37)-N6)-dimethylallyltransferase MiaA [Christensenellales bacterium]
MDKKMLVIAGPTGAGKTAVALVLAQMLGGEIVSADSIQVYRYMDIGSAKATLKERALVPHHMIDVVDPRENYSAAAFCMDAKKCIEGIQQRRKAVIIAGGTGLYIKALTSPMDFANTPGDEDYRAYLAGYAEQNGVDALHGMLRNVDPDAAGQIHKNNVKRVIRALEIVKATGQPMKSYSHMQSAAGEGRALSMVRLTAPKELLHKRIDDRVDKMMERGLVKEVQNLLDIGCKRNSTAMSGLGYKQLAMYLGKELSLQEAVHAIKQETKQYAKRQNTWFQREPMISIDISQYAGIEQVCLDIISKTGIL